MEFSRHDTGALSRGNSMPNNRRLSFDILNILACFAVVLIHHNGLVHSFQDTPAWRQALFAECSLYWCVPIFVMLSGATLLDYPERYSTRSFFKKRVMRTVVPWFSWSVILLFCKLWLGLIEIEPMTARECLAQILCFKVEGTYWYFGALFSLYLMMPVFAALRADRRLLWYIAAVSFVVNSALPIVQGWLGLAFPLTFYAGGGLSIFIVLGYLLRDWRPSRRQRIVVYVAGIASLLFRYMYTLHYSLLNGMTDTSIKGYATFHSVFLAIAVFVLVNHVDWQQLISRNMAAKLSMLSSCSFGVYLLHHFIMQVEALVIGVPNTSLIWRFAFAVLTYGISLCITMVLKRVPILRRIMG